MRTYARTVVVAGVWIGIASLAMPACGTSPQDLCELKCDCELCSEFEFEDCLRDADRDANEADFRACGAQYDELLACQDATGFCDRGDWETSCGPERDRFKSCMD